jgi:phosphatidylserine/phosphatidylglycerophosphate/cardiolipin synthase-like enzyme
MALIDHNFSLSDRDLYQIASALKSGRLGVPVSSMGLARIIGEEASTGVASALAEWSEMGLTPHQMAWTIEIIVQSRRGQPASQDILDLVLTGPESPGIAVRDTAAVVHELFSQADRSVLVVGYAIQNGRRLFSALADRMVAIPSLSVQLCFDIQRAYNRPDESAESLVAQFVQRFRQVEWPPDSPLPQVYFYPASLSSQMEDRSCLHAKCVVIDRRVALVSSANFTAAAHSRNIEAGVLIRSPDISLRLSQHFEALAHGKVLERII